MNESQKYVVDLIKQYWGNDSDVGMAMAFCESTYGDQLANPVSSARGIFQFIKSTWIEERNRMGEDPTLDLRFDHEENIKTGYVHYKKNGLQPWYPSIPCVNQYIK